MTGSSDDGGLAVIYASSSNDSGSSCSHDFEKRYVRNLLGSSYGRTMEFDWQADILAVSTRHGQYVTAYRTQTKTAYAAPRVITIHGRLEAPDCFETLDAFLMSVFPDMAG